MTEQERQMHSYLGDGVYAYFDGYSIRLRTGSHKDSDYEQQIWLDPNVLGSLNRFNAHVRGLVKENDDNN